MREGVRCLLMHEVPGARLGDNEARNACPFEHFFEDCSTPKCLIKAGLYNEIAMNVAGDEWRQAGLLKTIQDLAKGGVERKPTDVDEEGMASELGTAPQRTAASESSCELSPPALGSLHRCESHGAPTGL